MTIDELIRRMAISVDLHNTSDETALRDFAAAMQKIDSDPGEARRIRSMAEQIDIEIAAYDQGLAALDRGDVDAAEPLLRMAAGTEHGDADGILAELLAQPVDDAPPLSLCQRAAEVRAHRAILNAAYLKGSANPFSTPHQRSVLRRIVGRIRPRTAISASDLEEVLMAAMEVKDPHTRRHSERISHLVVLIGHEVGMRSTRLEAARLGGLFHDIGKLTIPATVLHKPGALTQEEFTLIQLHAVRGMRIVRDLPEFFDSAPEGVARKLLVAETLAGILHHHERFDGRGYPLGLAGDEIPEVSRVIAVADAFDSMTTARPYRSPRTIREAAAELRRDAGNGFDPQIVEAFLTVLEAHIDRIEVLVRENRSYQEAHNSHGLDVPKSTDRPRSIRRE
ncbi:HD domain-containing phosphohydrolase [Sphaerisporangium sp. NPDC005289]|uniref:HD-GYP domain-containing protein n=1 Tax=Sphaerisporangium sp. NPDC005289 TaxID=3155247 RepID=UPI0033BB544A